MARVRACERGCMRATRRHSLPPPLLAPCRVSVKKTKQRKKPDKKRSPRGRELFASPLLSHGSPMVSERLRRNRCYLPCRRHSWTRRHIPPPGANLLHRSLSVHLLLVRGDRGITGLQSPALCPPPARTLVSRSNNHLQQAPSCGAMIIANTVFI